MHFAWCTLVWPYRTAAFKNLATCSHCGPLQGRMAWLAARAFAAAVLSMQPAAVGLAHRALLTTAHPLMSWLCCRHTCIGDPAKGCDDAVNAGKHSGRGGGGIVHVLHSTHVIPPGNPTSSRGCCLWMWMLVGAFHNPGHLHMCSAVNCRQLHPCKRPHKDLDITRVALRPREHHASQSPVGCFNAW